MVKTGEIHVRILETYGSKGLPSCGMTDSNLLGSMDGSRTVYIGSIAAHIEPNTPRSRFPLAVLHELIPNKIPKNERNYSKVKSKRKVYLPG